MCIKASIVPISRTPLQQGEPAPQASISVAEGALGQETSVAQSRPRIAAAAASAIQGGADCGHRGAAASSREAEKSTAGVDESRPLFGPNGEIWERRPFSKYVVELMQPVWVFVRDQPAAADSESIPPLTSAEQSTTEPVADSAVSNNEK
jgi:hypothetical protein